jgi:hypothetical protein
MLTRSNKQIESKKYRSEPAYLSTISKVLETQIDKQ